MRLPVVIAGMIGLLALTGAAGDASAQTRSRVPAVTLSEASAAQTSTTIAPAQPRRSLRWTGSGRWGLDFNLNPSASRETEWGDVEAGAYYRLSPRLRVGAAAGLAAPAQDPVRAPGAERPSQPRVRLETLFRF